MRSTEAEVALLRVLRRGHDVVSREELAKRTGAGLERWSMRDAPAPKNRKPIRVRLSICKQCAALATSRLAD